MFTQIFTTDYAAARNIAGVIQTGLPTGIRCSKTASLVHRLQIISDTHVQRNCQTALGKMGQ